MSRSVSPGSFQSSEGGSSQRQPFFVIDLVRRFGIKAVLAIVVAAMFAFAPLTLLYWFNELSRPSVAISESGQRVVVKPGQFKQDQEREQPGETALLQVLCEVPGIDGYHDLLSDDDPLRRDLQASDSIFVRRELVYVRRAGHAQLPFGLLGKPPVSAWLPAGDYEILVVHEAPYVEPDFVAREYTFPWISVVTGCSLESRQKTTCRVPLPHYGPGAAAIQLTSGDESSAGPRPAAYELAPLLKACAEVAALPTPGGYLMALGEPRIEHSADHRHCVADPWELEALPREWTRDQLASLRNWLPADALSARTALSPLVDRLRWRESLQGWFCYVAAAVSGLVFTRWGAIAILEPWRRGKAWSESLGLLFKIALASVAAWILFNILTN